MIVVIAGDVVSMYRVEKESRVVQNRALNASLELAES